MNDQGPSDAKQTLLRALEAIEETEQEMNATLRHVAVVYSVDFTDDDGDVHNTLGWQHSSDPNWVIAALLTRVTDSIARSHLSEDDD